MRLRVFHAATSAQALANVRRELGEDALILATRRTAGGIEITAALGDADEQQVPLSSAPAASAATAAQIAASLRAHGVPEPCLTRLSGGRPLAEAILEAFRFAPLPLEPGRVIVLCGPPGAGKTLTTAKLATRLRLAGITPTVVAADGRRAGAVDQLAAFTRLLGLNLVVAPDVSRLAKAIARRAPEAPTLVDYAGTDPFSEQDGAELAAVIAAFGAEAALVLPAGIDAQEAGDMAEAMAARGVGHLVPTRLDFARRLGAVVAAAATGLAVGEGGIGPGAANGLVPLDPETLADWLLSPPAARRTPRPEIAA